MSISSVQSQATGLPLQFNPVVTFVVEEEEIQIESRFLQACQYFQTMLGSGLCESSTQRILVQEASKETVQTFLNFLKTQRLPQMSTQQLMDLYRLAHPYQHEALLSKIGGLLCNQIQLLFQRHDQSFPWIDMLIFACLYDDRQLKECCKSCITASFTRHNPNHAFLLQLIDAEAYDAIEEISTWSDHFLGIVTTYPNNSRGETAFFKLVTRGKYSVVAKLLRACHRHADRVFSQMEELVLQILNQEHPPSLEQTELLSAFATVFARTSYDSLQSIPFLLLIKGCSDVFEIFLNACNASLYLKKNPKGDTLLSVAIAHRRVAAIKALCAHKAQEPISFLDFSKYILQAIQIQSGIVLQEVLSFGIQHAYPGTILEVDFSCIEAAIETKKPEILEQILPYFKGYGGCKPDLSVCIVKLIETKNGYPIHLIFAPSDPSLLREFLARQPDLSQVSYRKENFFHLYCKTTETMLPLEEFSEQVERADPGAFDHKDGEGNTPLHYAIQSKKWAEALLLFQKNTETLWQTNAKNETPFRVLGGEAFEEMLNFFIASSDERCRRPLLLWCAQNYLYPFCEKLIPITPDIKTIHTSEGKNLLHLSAEAGAFFAASKCLELGFDINAKDTSQTTPLHMAVKNEAIDLVELFVDAGANPKICDARGETPLSYVLKIPVSKRSVAMQSIIKMLESRSCAVQ